MVDEEIFDGSKSNSKMDFEWNNAKNMDVWQDKHTIIVLNGG
jgi:hypothetical protein